MTDLWPLINGHPTLAVGFVNWAFVAAGLAAMAIPIVIHILNRRRFKTVTWAAMEFLLKAMRKNRRRLRFEQWVLLATRCAVVVLLGMALARPLGCERASMALAGGRTGVSVFVIDNSYSMAYEVNRPGGKTHLDGAKRIAKELVDRASRDGGIAVVIASNPARAIVARPSHDPQDVKDAIDRIEQSHGATDMPGALQLAMRIAAESNQLPDKSLYLFTDATASAWRSPEQAEALAKLGPEVARMFRVWHHNLSGGEPQSNGAVISARPQDNLVTSKFPADFAAAPKGFGSVADATVTWTLNDQPLATDGPLKLTPDTEAVTRGGMRFPTGGPQVIRVTLGGADRLKVDDTRYRVVDVASELKVLIVEGQRGIRPEEGSGFFLREALSPPRDAAPAGAAKTSSYVAAESINYLELGNRILDGYAAVLMAGVGQVPPTQADQLQRYVQQGGTVFWFMGDQVNAGNYNDVLLPRKLIPGPLVKLSRVGTNEQGYQFDFNPKSVHPYLRAFANQENTGLDTVTVLTYWQVDLPPDGSVNPILSYLPSKSIQSSSAITQPSSAAASEPHRDPAFTVHALGEGKVVFCSTSAGQEWTSFPANFSYVSVMHELLSSSIRTGDWWLNLTVGESLTIPPAVRLPAAPTLTDPAGRPVEVRAGAAPAGDGAASGPTVYRTDPLRRPGVYTLNMGTRQLPVAVNVPAAAEADVRTVPPEAIREALGGIDLTQLGPDLPPDAALADTGNDLSWTFMLLVLGLLAVECVMAMHFGHYRRTAPAAAEPAAGVR
jgi:hypothetical protein